MQSNSTNANSKRIYCNRERLDSSTSQKYRARKEPSKLRAADYVERKEYAKRDGEVPEEAFNTSRSMKVIGVNLQGQYENSMRCDKPSSPNLVSRTEVLYEVIQDRRCISAGSTLGVSAGRMQAKGFKHTQNHRFVKSCGLG